MLILDRAGWHVTPKFIVPANITLLVHSFEPIAAFSTLRRDHHFPTAFLLIPYRLASAAPEAFDRYSSARTACVVLAIT